MPSLKKLKSEKAKLMKIAKVLRAKNRKAKQMRDEQAKLKREISHVLLLLQVSIHALP